MALEETESNATATLEPEEVLPAPAEVIDDEQPEIAAPPPPPSILTRRPVAPPEAVLEPVEQPSRPGLAVRLVGSLAAPLVGALTFLDIPFATLGSGLKSIIGLVAIATSLIAVGTWGVVLFVPRL